MKKQNVQEFLDALALLDSEKHNLVIMAREKLMKLNSEVKERMMYGGIMFSITEDLGGIFVYKNHVSFEFGQGVGFDDPERRLEGSGKFRRHLKIKSIHDPSFLNIDFYLKQMLCQ